MRFRLQLWEMLGGEDVGQLWSTQDWRKWKDALLLVVDTCFGGSLLVAFICLSLSFVAFSQFGGQGISNLNCALSVEWKVGL